MGQILYINKPEGYTSFDVCNKLKRKFNTKRIGHTGTLDPNATGVLVVMIDEACKILPYIKHSDKTYLTSMKLGVKTTTGDIDGEIIEEKAYTMPTLDEVEVVLNSFLGKSKQLPPMTSAIKINGKKLYEYQRQNIEVKRELRDIEIKKIELVSIDEEIIFRTTVSAGTYIRSLVEDIGERLGSIATMTSLVREAVDDIDLSKCCSIEDVFEDNYTSYSIEAILSQYYTLIEYDKLDDLKNGKRIKFDIHDEVVMVCHKGKIIASYEAEEYPVYRCKRGLL